MAQNKRGILLAYDYYPSEGGIQTLMHSMVTADIGINWTVLTRKSDNQDELECLYNIVRTSIRPQLRFIDKLWLKLRRGRFSLQELVTFQTSRKLIDLGRKKKANFFFADQICSAFSVKSAANKLGIPWGLWVHGKELLEENQMNRKLLSDADIVIANSTFTRNLAVTRGANPDKTYVVHPCTDIKFFQPPVDVEAARKQVGVLEKKVLLTIAHLVPRKGHEQVIRSLPAIKDRFPDIVYLMIGRGHHEKSLCTLAEDLGVTENVKFLGYVPTEQLPLYYGASDIHVMPSKKDGDVEGFGISFIEAAACGTPSIGSRSGGIPYAITDGETGFLVEPGDLNGLTERIIEILDDENLRQKMGVASRNSAIARFSKDVFGQALLKVLQDNIL